MSIVGSQFGVQLSEGAEPAGGRRHDGGRDHVIVVGRGSELRLTIHIVACPSPRRSIRCRLRC